MEAGQLESGITSKLCSPLSALIDPPLLLIWVWGQVSQDLGNTSLSPLPTVLLLTPSWLSLTAFSWQRDVSSLQPDLGQDECSRCLLSRLFVNFNSIYSSHLFTGLLVIFARTHRLCAATVFGYICNCNLCAGKLSFLVLCLWCMLILKVDKIKCNGNVHKRREVLMFIVRGNFMN